MDYEQDGFYHPGDTLADISSRNWHWGVGIEQENIDVVLMRFEPEEIIQHF